LLIENPTNPESHRFTKPKIHIMKPCTNPLLHASRLALAAITLGAFPASAALSTWNGSAGVGDTNINTGANWVGGSTPTFNSSLQGLFQTTTAANINTNVTFGPTTTTPAVAFGGSFTMSAGGGIVTLYGTNSGTQPVLRTNSGASSVTIQAPIEIFSTAPSASPFGNLLVINVNNATAANTALNITGGISRASASTATTYDIRFGNNISPATTVAAKAKISGPISGLGSIVNANPGNSQWSGDFIIAGDQTLSTSNITISGGAGFGTPQTSARIVLGESNTDDQTWNNITLNNVMNLAVGGNITANVFSGNTLNTKITGASATGNIAFNSGTIGANVVLGGAGTNENDLSIIKKGSGSLNINSTTATYTGGTTVEAGTLNISNATNLASPITVKAGGTLAGEGSTSSSLTFDTGTSSLGFDATTTGSLTVGSLVTTGATVIASPTGATTIGVPYTVLTSSGGNFSSGDVSAFLAGGRGTIGGAGTNQITYTPAASASLTWKGNDPTNPAFWDIATTFNWSNGSPDRFFSNDSVTFDDTASSFTVAVQGGSISPGNMVFNNSLANPYTLTGGGIGGGASLTKNGTGLVTISNSLSHTGGITVNSGVLSLGTTNTNSFTGGINITGGELQFGGTSLAGSLTAQPVTMTGGTLSRITTDTTITNDTQAFAMNANGPVINVVSNATTTWRIGGKVSGSGNWTKSGPGVLSLGRAATTNPGNDFTGTLTVTGGSLDIRHGDSLGTTAGGTSIQGAILFMQNFGQTTGTTITVNEPLDFSGASFLNGYCQETKTFIQQFNGPVTMATGTVLGISTARNNNTTIAPTLELNDATITTAAGSVLSFGLQPATTPAGIFATAQTINVGSAITGPGSVTAEGEAGSVYTLTAPGYSGNTTVNSATLKLDAPNTNNQSSTVTIAATGATLELNFDETDGAVTDTVDKLFIGGVQQVAGTYKALDNMTDSGFPISQITGPGTLTVSSSPPAGGYLAWQTTNGALGQTVDQDHDNDGVDNGVEYFIGGTTNTTGFTATPVLNASNNITWTMGDTYTGTYGTDYLIQTSNELTIWDPVAEANVTIDNVAPGKSVSYTLTGPGKRFVRLLVNPN
jgi:autotransporter-associated beta strand protein